MPKTRPWAELAAKVEADPVRRVRMAEYERVMQDVLALARLRADLGLPEYDLEDESDDVPGTDPQEQEDPYVAALRDYIHAMGGHLEINAVFPDGTLTLLSGRNWASLIPAK